MKLSTITALAALFVGGQALAARPNPVSSPDLAARLAAPEPEGPVHMPSPRLAAPEPEGPVHMSSPRLAAPEPEETVPVSSSSSPPRSDPSKTPSLSRRSSWTVTNLFDKLRRGFDAITSDAYNFRSSPGNFLRTSGRVIRDVEDGIQTVEWMRRLNSHETYGLSEPFHRLAERAEALSRALVWRIPDVKDKAMCWQVARLIKSGQVLSGRLVSQLASRVPWNLDWAVREHGKRVTAAFQSAYWSYENSWCV